MNLFWLKYVSFAFLAGAILSYSVLRLNRLAAISRNALLGAYAACIVLACLTWHQREKNAEQFSPRQLVVGTVASVSTSHSRSGALYDDFQLQLESGSVSPTFSTGAVDNGTRSQPIHQGDYLGVLYRTWDNVPLTIDEFQGQRPGWHYRRYRPLDPYVWAVGIAGFVGFLGAFASSRHRSQNPKTETTLNLSD